MKNLQSLKGFIAGGLLTLGLVLGLSTAWAQFGSAEGDGMPLAQMAQTHGRDFGQQQRPGGPQGDHVEALAEALGVTVEELEAAHTAVMATARTERLEALATQLGVTVEELEAAQTSVRETQQAARLAELIASGQLTEEQAALIEAHQAVRTYLDVEGMQASMQAFWQTAIDDALAAGDITAEQAAELTSRLSEGPMGMERGFGPGRGMNGPGHGRGFNQP